MPLPKRTIIPSFSRCSTIFFPISGSRLRGNGGGVLLVTATSSPSFFNPTATSRPVAPPPTTTALFFLDDFAALSRAVLFSMSDTKWTPFPKRRLAPGIGRFMGDAPVASISESYLISFSSEVARSTAFTIFLTLSIETAS